MKIRVLSVWLCLLLCSLFFWGCSTTTPGIETIAEKSIGENSKEGVQSEPTPEPAQEVAPDAGPEPVVDAGDEPTPETVPENSPEVTPETTTDTEPQPDGVKVEPKKWVWVDVPGSRCGYGSQTGFGINASPGAEMLYIYLQGGGACWKDNGLVGNCFSVQPTAFNLKGFDKKKFESDNLTKSQLKSFTFRRDSPINPFANAHHAFIPYCTGDVFSGSTQVKFKNGKTMYFQGHTNMKMFLNRLKSTFPNLKRVVIAGSSAGGFGAAINWGLTQKIFGDKVIVDLLDDSGPPMSPSAKQWKEWRDTWKIVPPPGCKDCDLGIDNIFNHYAATLLKNGRRMAFLSFDRDSVIRTFYGLNDLTGRRFKDRLTLLLDRMDQVKGAHYYVLPGSRHTMLISGTDSLKNKKKVELTRWIEWFVKGDKSWSSYRD